MCFWKKKKKKERVYPSVYSEWITEFNRIGQTFFNEHDALTLSSGCLTDSKYSIDNFKRELTSFLEKQLSVFFADFLKKIEVHVEENDCEYLLLTIRRNIAKYNKFFFFEKFDFLDSEFIREVKGQLNQKIQVFEQDLVKYFDKISFCSPSMCDVRLNVKRIMEGKTGTGL